MSADDRIADVFSKVIKDLDPAIGDIVRNGERLGRRMRSRRRKLLAAGNTVAAVAVVGAVVGMYQARPPGVLSAAGAAGSSASSGASASPGIGHPGDTGRPAGTGRPSGTARPSGTGSKGSPQSWPVLKPGSSPSVSAGGGMTRHQMLHTLRGMLPAGSVVSDVRADDGRGSLEVDYNDGQGAVDLMLDVFGPGTIQSATCPNPLWTDEGTRPAGALPISCVMRTLADGSVERDAVMYADEFGFYGYDIYDQRPDGITVFIQVGNGILHTLPQVDRATPPGSMAQWEAVVENPAWHQ